MSNNIAIKEKIIQVLEDKNSEFMGIKFLKDYLNTTYDEKDVLNLKPKLIEPFIRNIKNVPFLPQTEKTWDEIFKTGDTRCAFLCAFDWGLSPEGYDFWYNISKQYTKKYKEKILNGLIPNAKVPKVISEKYFPNTTPYKIVTDTKEENEALKSKKMDYSHIEVSPTSETLQLMSFLNPIVRSHIVYPQIDVLNKTLEENNCLTEFYNNLKIKPKHPNYEKEFLKYLKGEDLRSVVYWAFNWATAKEGYQFWSDINAKVHSAITKDLISSFDKCHIKRQTQDPITHVTNINNEGKNNNNTQSNTMKQKHASEGYGSRAYGYSHYDCFFDEYDDYDEYYDSIYGYGDYYGGGVIYSTYKPSIPKDIIEMQVNNNFIKIEQKVEATVSA